MPFIPIYNIAKYQNYKDTPKIAKVINNNDPSKLGRIKVQLPGMYEPKDSEGSNLPWIRRMQDTFLCGSGELFSIPDQGSFVEIIWPYDNKNAFYRGLPYSKQSKTELFDQDYPNEWGFTDGNFTFKINKVTKDFIINTGEILIEGKEGKNITIKAKEVKVQAENASISANSANISASNVNIGSATKIDGRTFLQHKHYSGDGTTGGVV